MLEGELGRTRAWTILQVMKWTLLFRDFLGKNPERGHCSVLNDPCCFGKTSVWLFIFARSYTGFDLASNRQFSTAS